MSKITISLSRTVQLQQYEPLTLSIQEEIELPKGLDAKEQKLFKAKKIAALGKLLQTSMEHEQDRYRQ